MRDARATPTAAAFRRAMRPAALLLCSPALLAQTLSGLQLEPASASVGQPVRITARFDDADSPNCSLRVHFGDGQVQDFRINQSKDVPLVIQRRFDEPGRYTVMAEPKTALPMLKCLGKNQTATLEVVAAVAPAAAVTVPQCPPGWKLDAKSVDRKTGAYTCTAKVGAPLPAVKPACPAPLAYYENKLRGRLGCRA